MRTFKVSCCLIFLLAVTPNFGVWAGDSTFVKGINLNGPAVTVDGNAWISYSQALASGFTSNAPSSFAGTYSFALNPTPDAATRTVLESALYRPQPPNGQGFTLTQTLGNGSYDIYIWMIENHASNYRDIDVKLEGTTVATGISDLPLGSWAKYGPYRTTVTDGVLTIDLLRRTKGDPAAYGLAIFSASPDTQAPSAPGNLAVTSKTSGTVSLSWSSSSDNVSVAGYEVLRGATLAGTTTVTSFTDTGLSASTSYTYTVRAFDGAGNRSNASNAVSVTTNVPGANPPIALHPQNGHYFLFRNQPTVLVTSGEHYGALVNLDFDYVTYLNTLAADNLNLTRTWAGPYVEAPGDFGISSNTLAPLPNRFIAPWARSNVSGYANGGNKFDLNQWDAAYFARLKDYVAQAAARGVVIELTLFCTFYNDGQWNISPLKASNNINGIGTVGREQTHTLNNGNLMAVQEAYVRKVVAELRDYDNVIYEICNEPYFGGVSLEWQARIADIIYDAESAFPARHLITQNINNGSNVISNPNPKVSVFNFHYCAPPNAVAQNYGLNKVIGDNETGFAGSADVTYRTEGWNFIIAGGALYNNLDYSFTPQSENGTAVQSAPGGGSPALRAQLKILANFMKSFSFVSMAPNDGVIKGGVPSGASARALVQNGQQYGVYVRGGSQANLVIELPAGSYRAEWINTKSGATDKTEDFTHAGGNRTVASPNYSEDIALRIKNSGTQPPQPPGTGAGKISREVWTGIAGDAVTAIPLTTPPNLSSEPTSFEAPTDFADNYGTRMRGYVHPPTSGAYTFWIAGDDNCELWLSSSENPAIKIRIALVPEWTSSREWSKYPAQQSAAITLVGGQKYYIEALHKEGVGGDNLAVAWQGPSIPQAVIAGQYLSPWVNVGNGSGLRGEYYNNIDFTSFAFSRVDATVNFDFGEGSPDASVGAETFSARWRGQVEAIFGETYTFYVRSDDGVRLWVNGQLVIDKWIDQGPTEYSATVALTAGQKADVRMDFYENGGGAVAQLSWSSARTAKQIIPQSQLYPAASNRSPQVSSSATATPNPAAVNQNVSFSVAASDPDGDALSVTWDFGDGTTAAGAGVSHAYAVTGVYTATALIDDNRDGLASSSVQVIVNNGGGSQPGTVRVNFQLATSETPAGYLADGGLPYGPRGNGYTYGWNAANSAAHRDRNAPNSADQRYDTLAHLQKPENPNAVWEIELPNGNYSVRAVCGDPSYFDSVFSIEAEGVLVVNATPSATVRWFEGTRTVSVNDGRLTIRNANGAQNNKLCFVDIASVAAGGGAMSRELEAAAMVAEPLDVTLLQVAMSFTKAGRDTFRVAGELPTLEVDFVTEGSTAGVDVGAAIVSFTLDKKGRAKNANGSLQLTLKNGSWSFKAALKKGQWSDEWSDGGLNSETVKKAPTELPVTLTLGARAFGGSKDVLYTAKESKAGKAR